MASKDVLPPSVSFVARSGTGKTTLVESLIAEFSRRGRRVGAVKHTSHEVEIDREGKDSWRLSNAGASPVVLSSPREMAVVRKGLEKEIPLMEILATFMKDVELVLVEGYKSGPLPKIEVHRSQGGGTFLCLDGEGEINDRSLIAVVADVDLSLPVPCFALDDSAAICDFLEERFLAGTA